MLTHPDTVRPDTALGAFFAPFSPTDEAAAMAMSIVILRQAGESRATTLQDFRDAPETSHLTSADLERNLGRARELADPVVIRQDAYDYRPPQAAGEVHGIREATAEDELAEASDATLIDIGVASCAELVTDDAIVGALLQRGLRPSAISRIWPELRVRLADHVAAIDKPRLVRIAMAARAREAV